MKRVYTNGRIGVCTAGLEERAIPHGRIAVAGKVGIEREYADGRIVDAGGAIKERALAYGRVYAAGRVATQSECSRGGVENAGGVLNRVYAPLAVFCCPVVLL